MGIPVSSAIITNTGAASLGSGLYSLDHGAANGVDRLYIYGRNSSTQMIHAGRLDDQMALINDACAELAIEILGQRAGWERGFLDGPRPHFKSVLKAARKDGCGVLARDVARYLRTKAFHGQNNPLAEPTREELDELIYDWADGVPLYTLFDPNLSAAEIRGQAIRHGKNKPGRPRAFNDDDLELIVAMRQQGETFRAVAREFGLKSPSTIHDALKRTAYIDEDKKEIAWRDLI